MQGQKKDQAMYIDIEDRDPIWLKDKGDHFFKRHDYQAAINAYTKALEFDKEFLMVFLNRAACWLKIRAFENTVKDVDDILTIIAKVGEDEKKDDFYAKVEARAQVKKGAA